MALGDINIFSWKSRAAKAGDGGLFSGRFLWPGAEESSVKLMLAFPKECEATVLIRS